MKDDPSQWQRLLQIRNGCQIPVRPIRAEDEDGIRELLRRTRGEDLRLRFFGVVKEFSHSFLAGLTQLDFTTAMAFVAFDGTGSDVVGVVRLHSDTAYERGEYAILVRSDFKGMGLGLAMMHLLIAYARREGLKEIFGYVLRENAPMLAMCRTLGFEIDAGASAPEVLDVSLKLT